MPPLCAILSHGREWKTNSEVDLHQANRFEHGLSIQAVSTLKQISVPKHVVPSRNDLHVSAR